MSYFPLWVYYTIWSEIRLLASWTGIQPLHNFHREWTPAYQWRWQFPWWKKRAVLIVGSWWNYPEELLFRFWSGRHHSRIKAMDPCQQCLIFGGRYDDRMWSKVPVLDSEELRSVVSSSSSNALKSTSGQDTEQEENHCQNVASNTSHSSRTCHSCPGPSACRVDEMRPLPLLQGDFHTTKTNTNGFLLNLCSSLEYCCLTLSIFLQALSQPCFCKLGKSRS